MPAHASDFSQIVGAKLRNFDAPNLRTASLGLLEALGYASSRSLPIDSLAELREAFDTEGLLTEENALLSKWLSVHFLFQLTDQEIRASSEGTLDLGLEQNDYAKEIKSYVFFAVDLKPRPDGTTPPRSELGAITRALNKLVPQPVLVLFRHGDTISLAIINRRRNMRDGTRDVLTRVSLIRDIDFKNPHRAHLDLLHRFSLHTLKESSGTLQRFADLDSAWQKLLSVQELKNSFYRDLVDWFRWAVGEIRLAVFPDLMEDTPKNRDRATQEFAVRLICRTLFSWFLKEMSLVPKDLLELYTLTDERRYLCKGKYDPEGNGYYRGILQNIFFQALNRPMDQRRKTGAAASSDATVTDSALKKLAYIGKNFLPADFDYDLFDRIPYLNGGLFDALIEDNASDTIDDARLSVPNRIFYAKKEDGFTVSTGAGRRQQQRAVEGLNRILDRYRFTVAENTPLEEDVALDPELLGLVFENLLAEIDPDDEAAAASARKESGSYYTPRQIVDYMVNEALHLHLKTQFEKELASPEDIQLLARLCYGAGDERDFAPIAERVVRLIGGTRVLDPACGSGAFPMGMLHRMVELLSRVDPDNQLWKNRLLERLPAEIRDDARRGMEGKSYNYLRKLGVIQKNLYGSDIQPLAALIAKLRFFLTLVIEQEVDLNDRKHNYGLQSLPNLETNIVCANALRDVEHGLLAGATIKELRSKREEYYQPTTSAQRRDELAKEIGGKLATLFPGFAQQTKGLVPRNNQQRYEQDSAWLAEWFKHATVAAPFFNVETFFPELVNESPGTLGGELKFMTELGELADRPPENISPFHIVIGNPPYGGTSIPEDIKDALALGSKDPYGAFVARFMGDPSRTSPLSEDGVLAYIVSDTFMTIKTHRPLREQMLKHRVHKMVRVSGDTFKATVNCAVILCQRGAAHASHACQMADLTNVSIHEQYERFLHLLFQTEGTAQISRRQNISNQTYAIYHYRQSLISTYSNKPFFVASPKLFALMNDTTSSMRQSSFHGRNVPVRTVQINGQPVDVIKLGDIADIKVGLQTGDNDSYIYQNPNARGSYRSIDDFRNVLLQDADLQRIRADESLRRQVVEKGISKEDSKSPRYFGGRYIVPYDKGGEAAADTGWMPNYYVPTNYFIDWSEWAVSRMTTLTTRERNRLAGKSGGDETLCSRFQNADSYFKPAITFSRTGVYAPTFRFNSSSPYDTEGSMMFFADNQPLEDMIGVVASRLVKYQLKAFIGHTVHTQIDELKEAVIPLMPITGIADHVQKIVANQQLIARYDYASTEQLLIDQLIYSSYGLNEGDMAEVEEWYFRRYPSLAQAQRRNAAVKQGLSADDVAARSLINLYCDESRHLPKDREPVMLMGALSCPANNVQDLHSEMKELCKAHGLAPHFEIKWAKVSPGKLPLYQAVLDWFLSKEVLTFSCLVLPDKQATFQRLPDASQDHLYYSLYYQLLRQELEPENRYRAFLDMKDTRGRQKLQELTRLLKTDAGELSQLERMQHVRSHEIGLMHIADFLLGMVGFARSRADGGGSQAKRALVQRMQDQIGYPLTSDSPPGSTKMRVATWYDSDALLL